MKRSLSTLFAVLAVLVTAMFLPPLSSTALALSPELSPVKIAAYERYIRAINPAAPAREIVDMVVRTSLYYNDLSPIFVLAILEQESAYNPKAIGRAGERGLGQLMPATAADLWVPWQDAFRIDVSVDATARYLSRHLRTYGGNILLAAKRYNGGSVQYALQVERRIARLQTKIYRA